MNHVNGPQDGYDSARFFAVITRDVGCLPVKRRLGRVLANEAQLPPRTHVRSIAHFPTDVGLQATMRLNGMPGTAELLSCLRDGSW